MGTENEPLPAQDDVGWSSRSTGDTSEPSECGQRAPFVSTSFAVREERPPLVGLRLMSTEHRGHGDVGTTDPGPANHGRRLSLSLELVKVTLLPWEVGLCGVGGQDEEEEPRLMIPPSMASLARTCALPTQEPSSG